MMEISLILGKRKEIHLVLEYQIGAINARWNEITGTYDFKNPMTQ